MNFQKKKAEQNKEQIAEQRKQFYQANKEQKRQYYQNNKDEINRKRKEKRLLQKQQTTLVIT